MELFGEKLREVRESKKYTIDQVARETRISKRYLIALENGDFQAFPGETYLIGFLRSYAEYLDLEPDHYVNLYKNIKIQEQPIPFDELLDTQKKVSPLFIILTVFLGTALAAAVGVILYLTVFSGPVKKQITEIKDNILTSEESKGKTYVFNDEVMTDWFRKGDIIIIPIGENEFPIEIMVAEKETDLKVIDRPVVLSMGNEEALDLNTDGKPDISLILNDFKESEYGNEINIGIYKTNVSKLVYTEEDLQQEEEEDTKTTSEDEEAAVDTGAVPEEAEEEDISMETEVVVEEEEEAGDTGPTLVLDDVEIKEETRSTIIKADKPEPFVVSIVFRDYCLFRYIIDRKTMDQRNFAKDDSITLTVTQEVRLLFQNAHSVKVTIAGKPVVLGKAGQVVTVIAYWVKDESSGEWILEIASMY